PEKMIRVNEVVDEDGATIACALVKIIAGEISSIRKQTFGYTAEQITTKIETDPSVLSIITHLLKQTKEPELKRLLLTVIPQRYLHLQDFNNQSDEGHYVPRATFSRLAKCYRLAFETASDEIKRAVAQEFIRAIKEESAEVIDTYKSVFFKGGDLEYFPPQEVQVIKSYLLSNLSENPSASFIDSIAGIGRFLTTSFTNSEVESFIDGIIHYAIENSEEIDVKQYLDTEYWLMEEDAQRDAMNRLETWVKFLLEKNDNHFAEKLKEYIEYIKI